MASLVIGKSPKRLESIQRIEIKYISDFGGEPHIGKLFHTVISVICPKLHKKILKKTGLKELK